MMIFSNTEVPHNLPPAAATIGFFDGVHTGHCHLIADIKAQAAAANMASMVVTFDNHPRKVLNREYIPQLLSTTEEKTALIARTGVDYCCLLHFDRDMAALSAHNFMRTILREQLNVRRLIIGYDNRFGHNRSEGFADYVAYGSSMGMEVIQSTPFDNDGDRVSSSLIRRSLEAGNVADACRLLGRPYSIAAPVTGGYKEGRRMGFRTANLDMTLITKMLPMNGVYATRVRIDDRGGWLPAMTNIGQRPTFDRGGISIETFIFDFDADLYDRQLEVAFCHRLRDEQRFAGEAELANQLKDDEERARLLLKQTP